MLVGCLKQLDPRNLGVARKFEEVCQKLNSREYTDRALAAVPMRAGADMRACSMILDMFPRFHHHSLHLRLERALSALGTLLILAGRATTRAQQSTPPFSVHKSNDIILLKLSFPFRSNKEHHALVLIVVHESINSRCTTCRSSSRVLRWVR